jgi:hypothetical protein
LSHGLEWKQPAKEEEGEINEQTGPREEVLGKIE